MDGPTYECPKCHKIINTDLDLDLAISLHNSDECVVNVNVNDKPRICSVESCPETTGENFKCIDCTFIYCYYHKDQEIHKCLDLIKDVLKENRDIPKVESSKKQRKVSEFDKENKKQSDQLREFRNAQKQKYEQSIIAIQLLDDSVMRYMANPGDTFGYIRDYINRHRSDGHSGPYSITAFGQIKPFTISDTLISLSDLNIDPSTILILTPIDESHKDFQRINMYAPPIKRAENENPILSTIGSFGSKLKNLFAN